jgi:hypothetical protein
MLLKRRILLPWLLSSAAMYGLSYLWHGIALTDLSELKVPMALYLALSGVVYLLIGAGITAAVHWSIVHEWISLKTGFPFWSALVGAVVGFMVYLLVFTLGMSFASHALRHVVVDVLWQMFEQAIGGLLVSLGIIYDMHRSFLEAERAK